MKRILLIEPDAAARETIAQLLARDYRVSARAGISDGGSFADAVVDADLVIARLGVWRPCNARCCCSRLQEVLSRRRADENA
jgi:hypothetical protein